MVKVCTTECSGAVVCLFRVSLYCKVLFDFLVGCDPAGRGPKTMGGVRWGRQAMKE